MECTHGELCTRLADRLCGDDADCLSHVDEFAVGEVDAVALLTDTTSHLTGHRAADDHRIHAHILFHRFGVVAVEHVVALE